MKNMKLTMATLAIGSVLTLLAPVTAAARERDDFHAADRDRGRTEQRWNGEDRVRFNNNDNENRNRDADRFHRDRGFQDRYQGHDRNDRR